MQISLTSIITPLTTFFRRYHFLLFFVATIIGMSVAMFFINEVIKASDEPGDYVSEINNTKFDEETIKRLQELSSGNQSDTDLNLGGVRSPF